MSSPTDHAHAVDVAAPVRVAYNQWTQFEEFPRFMDGVESVTQLTDDRLHWVVNIAGVSREFDTTITEQTPDHRIAWTTNSGTVRTMFCRHPHNRHCSCKLKSRVRIYGIFFGVRACPRGRQPVS